MKKIIFYIIFILVAIKGNSLFAQDSLSFFKEITSFLDSNEIQDLPGATEDIDSFDIQNYSESVTLDLPPRESLFFYNVLLLYL